MDTVIIREPLDEVNKSDMVELNGHLYIVTDVDCDDDRGYTVYTVRPVEPIEIEEADAAEDEPWRGDERTEDWSDDPRDEDCTYGDDRRDE
jgi:hypothetical protein